MRLFLYTTYQRKSFHDFREGFENFCRSFASGNSFLRDLSASVSVMVFTQVCGVDFLDVNSLLSCRFHSRPILAKERLKEISVKRL
jgi:hypothetical protein